VETVALWVGIAASIITICGAAYWMLRVGGRLRLRAAPRPSRRTFLVDLTVMQIIVTILGISDLALNWPIALRDATGAASFRATLALGFGSLILGTVAFIVLALLRRLELRNPNLRRHAAGGNTSTRKGYAGLVEQLPEELQQFASEFPDYLTDGLQERVDSKIGQRRFFVSEVVKLLVLIGKKRLVHLVVRRERTVRW